MDPVGENQLLFETDKHLGIIKSPVMILHAEDDMVVPYQLGRRVCIWYINREFVDHFSFLEGGWGGSKHNSLTLLFKYSPLVQEMSVSLTSYIVRLSSLILLSFCTYYNVACFIWYITSNRP